MLGHKIAPRTAVVSLSIGSPDVLMLSRNGVPAACLHPAPAGHQPLFLCGVLAVVAVGTLFMFLGDPVRVWRGVKISKVRGDHAKDTRGKRGSFGVCLLALFVYFETRSSLKFTR